ncbi:hypothetical protein CLU83_1425 [Flavobacterium sp. 1]|nr:hypothetical protein CLU83_1425 [Flavobacterium sp. 1]
MTLWYYLIILKNLHLIIHTISTYILYKQKLINNLFIILLKYSCFFKYKFLHTKLFNDYLGFSKGNIF